MSHAPVLAAIATQERRAHLLPQVLASLRPQVDRLHVYLNGWREAPACVRNLADLFVLSRENEGAERKLFWADKWQGLYCSADDDIIYPKDYTETVRAAVEKWNGRAIVTGHGRSYLGRARTVHNVAPGSVGYYHQNVRPGRFVNHAGTGASAWDARTIRVPSHWSERNVADLQFAIWAQRNKVPIWLIPHEANWFKPLAMLDPDGLFKRSQVEQHRRRNALLSKHGSEYGWKLHEINET